MKRAIVNATMRIIPVRRHRTDTNGARMMNEAAMLPRPRGSSTPIVMLTFVVSRATRSRLPWPIQATMPLNASPVRRLPTRM